MENKNHLTGNSYHYNHTIVSLRDFLNNLSELDIQEDEIMEIQSVLDEGRDAMIKTNIYVNEFAKKLFISSFVDGNTNAAVASKTLEALFPELLKLNKSLKLDCTEYKNGAPVSTKDEYGNSNPVETLPEEKRILK